MICQLSFIFLHKKGEYRKFEKNKISYSMGISREEKNYRFFFFKENTVRFEIPEFLRELLTGSPTEKFRKTKNRTRSLPA